MEESMWTGREKGDLKAENDNKLNFGYFVLFRFGLDLHSIILFIVSCGFFYFDLQKLCQKRLKQKSPKKQNETKKASQE